MKLVLLAVLLLATQQALPPKPALKSNVTVVEVDVVVTDKSGAPVRGLTRDDFEIAEDGTPVEIVSFSAIDLPETPRERVILPTNRSGSAFASNDHPHEGRVILIVLDDIQVNFTAARMETMKAVARRAVERLGPSDIAGVLTTSGTLGGQAEFTTDRSQLFDAIARFVPQGEHDLPAIASAPPSVPGVNSRAERLSERRTQAAMSGLTVAARALATIQHRRKGVLLISQGFPATVDEIIRDPKIGAAWESIQEFILTAQRSNVAVYTVDPCGLEVDAGCTKASRQNVRTIAELTGGFAVINTNAPEAGVDRMLIESGSYYLLGYTSPAPANDGKHHRIRVRTRVPGVDVRAREGYDSPAAAAKAAATPPLDALTHSAIQTRGLTMRVVAIPAPLSEKPLAAVVVGIELPAPVAMRAGRIEFAIVAIDREGKTRARVRFTTNFTAASATSSSWIRTGSRIDLAPGPYQIRVAGIGGDNLQGSVYTDVTVPKFDTELGVGGLSLGASTPVAVTEADRLRSVLALIPFAANQVAEGAAVAAQLPIRIASRGSSGGLTITATLVRPDGTSMTLDRTEAAGHDYATAAGKVYRVALPPALAAGSYRVVVESTLGRTTVARELAFAVLPRR